MRPWSAYRTENGSAVLELRCRSASAASWSGPAEGPTEYKVAARRFAPNGELPSDYRSAFLHGELDRKKPIQAHTSAYLAPEPRLSNIALQFARAAKGLKQSESRFSTLCYWRRESGGQDEDCRPG